MTELIVEKVIREISADKDGDDQEVYKATLASVEGSPVDIHVTVKAESEHALEMFLGMGFDKARGQRVKIEFTRIYPDVTTFTEPDPPATPVPQGEVLQDGIKQTTLDPPELQLVGSETDPSMVGGSKAVDGNPKPRKRSKASS